jgi:WD40 repeat protein
MAAIDPFGNLVVFDPITGTVVAEVDSVGAMECFCDIDWSPDRSTIAVANDQGTVSLIDTTGWNVEILEIEGDDGMRVGSPTWSPDSEWLAFTYRRPSVTILLEGSDVSSIDWSPIFKEIAGLVLEPLRGSDPRALEVILIDADGAGHETLTEAGECFCIGYQPGIGWSPDGTMLALNVPLAEPSTSSLWTISRDGSGLVQGRCRSRPEQAIRPGNRRRRARRDDVT